MSMAHKYRMAKGGSIKSRFQEKKDDRTNLAEGGEVSMDDPVPSPKAAEMTKSMRKAFHYAEGGAMPCKACGYAEGGFVDEEDASGFLPMPEENQEHNFFHEIPNQSEDSNDIASSIMRDRSDMKAKGYSEGGQVANDTEVVNPDDMDSQYDELVKDDELESSYTGKNSGDEDGNEELDEEDRDVVSAAMKSRKKKDKNPKPA